MFLLPLRFFKRPDAPQTSKFIREEHHAKLIVFIHGITGNAHDTWFNKKSGAYWPALLAEDPDFSGFDVYVVSYPTTFLGRGANIEETATRLSQQFKDRGFYDRYKEIYFIAHSMGGLIAKRMLLDLDNEHSIKTLRQVRAVLFLSTPAQGSPLARFVAWGTFNPQFDDLRSAVGNTFLQTLDNQWEALLRARDAASASFPRSYAAYEKKRLWGLFHIVDRLYAKTRADDAPYAMDFVHGDIAKPFSREGDPYEWARDKILNAAGREQGRRLPKADPYRFSIGVAHLLNDEQRNVENLIYESLTEFDGIRVLAFDRTIEFDAGSPESIKNAHIRAKSYLTESGAHAILWGNVLTLQGRSIPKLYWTTLSLSDSMQKGAKYSFTDDLSLPEVFWNHLKELLFLLVTSQYSRFEEQKGNYLAERLKPFLDRVQSLLERIPTQSDWTPSAIAQAKLIFGRAATTYGEQSGDSKSLSRAVQILRETLQEYTRERAPLSWAMTQNNLGIALSILGQREAGTARLEEALMAYRAALEVYTRERVPLEWARTQNNLANVLSTLGKREAGTTRLKEAVTAYQAALEVYTREPFPLDWAITQSNLGTALSDLGEREAGTARLEEAVTAYRAVLEVYTRERFPLDWARTQNKLASGLSTLGKRAAGTARLEEAVTLYRAALEEHTRERVPLEWAMTQNNLANALKSLGQREAGTARLEEAVTAYRAALEEHRRERVPLSWAMTQNNLGIALSMLGEREPGTARLKEAVTAYRAALEERTRERVPLDWAGTQNNLAIALSILGEREAGTARLEEAVTAYRAALEETTRERVPLDWAGTQSNLANVLRSLGERETGTARLKEAVTAYRVALEERTRERVPWDWAGTQNNLAIALSILGVREAGTTRLEEAVTAYRAALQEYTQERAPLEWARIQENLRKALRILDERGLRL